MSTTLQVQNVFSVESCDSKQFLCLSTQCQHSMLIIFSRSELHVREWSMYRAVDKKE